MLRSAHLRVARPTDNLAEVVRFYQDGLGFEILGSFENHDGYHGVMLGHRASGFHLEFTHLRDEKVGRAPTKENLLVFYLPEQREWQAAVSRLSENGHTATPAENPYWDRNGVTFEDPDGYRIVLQNTASPV